MESATLETTRSLIDEALHEVSDPELGINVVDLGLVYTIAITEDGFARVAESGESAGSGGIMESIDTVRPSQLIAMATHGYGGL